jgi:hypothetical protein
MGWAIQNEGFSSGLQLQLMDLVSIANPNRVQIRKQRCSRQNHNA